MALGQRRCRGDVVHVCGPGSEEVRALRTRVAAAVQIVLYPWIRTSNRAEPWSAVQMLLT